MLLLTEKNQKSVPTCEQGYWGGFSPKRKGGKYQDQALTKKYTDGRARLYPARKMPKDTQQSEQRFAKWRIISAIQSLVCAIARRSAAPPLMCPTR